MYYHWFEDSISIMYDESTRDISLHCREERERTTHSNPSVKSKIPFPIFHSCSSTVSRSTVSSFAIGLIVWIQDISPVCRFRFVRSWSDRAAFNMDIHWLSVCDNHSWTQCEWIWRHSEEVHSSSISLWPVPQFHKLAIWASISFPNEKNAELSPAHSSTYVEGNTDANYGEYLM